MIEVLDLFVVDLQVGGTRDVLRSPDDLISFRIVTGARGELPSLEMSFTSSNLDVFKSLTEKNTLRFTYGKTLNDARCTEWEFKFPEVSKIGNDKYIYSLMCILKVDNYLSNSKIQCIKGSSKTAIAKALESCGVDLDAKVKCNDTMTWIQDSTCFKFIQDTFLRYWSGDTETCAAVAMTLDKKLRYYDLKYHVDSKIQDPDFLTTMVGGGSTLSPDMFKIKNGNGILTEWVGNGRDFIQYDMDTGMVTDIRPKLKSSLFETQASIDQKLSRDESKAPRATPPQPFCSDNVHEKWNEAYAQNLTRLALVSSIGLELQYNGEYIPLDPLDVVTVTSQEINEGDSNFNRYSYTYTGVYIVDAWSLSLINKQLITRIDLTRDANSDIKEGG